MNSFELVQAESVAEAVKAMETKPNARLKGAGVDLLDEMKMFVASPDRVVNLLKIKSLRGIVASKGGTEIGALTTLAQIAAHDGIRKELTALAEAAAEAATPEVRNMATVGGNLCQRPRCWYYRSSIFTCLKKGGKECPAKIGENKYHAIFDNEPCSIVHPSNLATALIALDAFLEVTGPKGERQIAVEKFFTHEDVTRENVLAHGEVITKILLPLTSMKSAYRETREKQSFDWALTSAAVALQLDGKACKAARVVLGAVAPTPLRRKDVEAMLVDQQVTPKLAEAAGAKAAEGAAPLSQNTYKVALVKAAVRRAIMAAAGLKEE